MDVEDFISIGGGQWKSLRDGHIEPATTPPPTSSLLLGNWDHERATNDGDSGQLNCNVKIDADMAAAVGHAEPVSQMVRGYWNDHPSSFTSTSPLNSATSFQNAAMANFKVGGDYAGVLAGNYDATFTSFWNSVPTNITMYATLQHEPENDSGIVPADWRASVAHYVDLVAPIIRSRGLKGGVGGLLMGSTFKGSPSSATIDTWAWWREVSSVNLGQTVFMLDPYYKFLSSTTTEDTQSDLEAQFDIARADGVTRFGIGETGISRELRNGGGQLVGDTAGQATWIRREIPKWRLIDGLEFVLYFHTETGPASANDNLNGDALLAWAQGSVGQF